MEIVPLTPAEDAELRREPTAGELGLCGTGENACAPKCCQDKNASNQSGGTIEEFAEVIAANVRMTREEAKADAAREFTAISIDPNGGIKLDEPFRPAVDVMEPGWAPKLAELLGGAHMSILLEAEKITNGQRQKDYGTALDNHERIARLWNAFLQNKGWGHYDLGAEDVAMMMILMKLARAQNEVTEDTLIDIAGYANVIDKMGPQRAARAARLADEL